MSFLEKRPKVWNLLKTILVVLLFSTQHIIDAGWAISFRISPIFSYVYVLLSGHANPAWELEVMFLLKSFIVGRIIAAIGVIILGLAAFQYFRNRTKHDFMNTGIFSKVRHPQFMGISIVGFGLTVMALTYGGGWETFVLATTTWFIQALGYITIARVEEWRLTKKFGEKYKQYQQKVPFMVPIKGPSRIPETAFTILIAFLTYILLIILPYNLIYQVTIILVS